MRHFMAIEFLNERHLKKSQISLISWREKPGGNLLALDSRKLKGQFFVVPLKAFHSATIQGLPGRSQPGFCWLILEKGHYLVAGLSGC